jgi:hypothetical protein
MKHKNRKSEEISCFEVLYVLFYGLKASPVSLTPFIGLRIFQKMQFWIKKCDFFQQ